MKSQCGMLLEDLMKI